MRDVMLALAIILPPCGMGCFMMYRVTRWRTETDKDLLAYKLEMLRMEEAREHRLLGDGK